MSLSLAPRPDKWSVRKAMEKDIALVADWEPTVTTVGGKDDVRDDTRDIRDIRAARIEGLREELRFDHADMVEKDKRPVCWVGNWYNGDAGSYYLSVTPAPALSTITPLVECWRTILDHYFMTIEAQLIRVNIDAEDPTQVVLLRNLGFEEAPATTNTPDYLRMDDPDPALVCTRERFLHIASLDPSRQPVATC